MGQLNSKGDDVNITCSYPGFLKNYHFIRDGWSRLKLYMLCPIYRKDLIVSVISHFPHAVHSIGTGVLHNPRILKQNGKYYPFIWDPHIRLPNRHTQLTWTAPGAPLPAPISASTGCSRFSIWSLETSGRTDTQTQPGTFYSFLPQILLQSYRKTVQFSRFQRPPLH